MAKNVLSQKENFTIKNVFFRDRVLDTCKVLVGFHLLGQGEYKG